MNKQYFTILIHDAVAAVKETIASLLSWLIGYPLTFIFQRKNNLTVVVCRPAGMFSDNSKYFFVYANEYLPNDHRIILLSSDDKLIKDVFLAGGSALRHPSIESLLMLLRCNTIATDLYISNYYPLTRGAKTIQLWHGAPLKHIELDVHQKRLQNMPPLPRTFLRIQKAIIGRYPLYDLVIATSRQFIEKAFSSSFNAREFASTGYPRNDILFGWPDKYSLAYRLSLINVDSEAIRAILKFKDEGRKICVYAPTFRQDYPDPFESAIDLFRLSHFAKDNNLFIVLKLHPFMKGKYKIDHYPYLLEYDPHGDIYPMLAISDLLITDYSSIFFDYLLLDRPMIFFAYDLDAYLEKDRDMYFDYETITPGDKCKNQDELERCLRHLLSNNLDDSYGGVRSKIRSLAHDHCDNQSCRRLIDNYLKSEMQNENH